MSSRRISGRWLRSRLSRRQFLIAGGLAAAGTRLLAQDPADKDIILQAMRDELTRSRQLRVVGGGGDDAPYFIGYMLDDNDAFEVTASFGALTSRSRNRFRLPNIQVRVGNYDFDNTGHIYSGYYTGSRYDTEPLPLDDDYLSLREGFWLERTTPTRRRSSPSRASGRRSPMPPRTPRNFPIFRRPSRCGMWRRSGAARSTKRPGARAR